MAIKKDKMVNSKFACLGFFLLYACSERQLSAPRDFFTETKENYYDKSLDSLGLLGFFGINSSDTFMDSKRYWKINNAKPNFFFIQGFLRHDSGIVYLKPLLAEGSKNQSACEDQVLFSFKKDQIGTKRAVHYTCNTPLILADSIELQNKTVDAKNRDTFYTYAFKSFFLSNATKDIDQLFNTTLVTVSREKGIIGCVFTTGYDSIKVRFYPTFSRLDSNYFKRKII